MPLSPCGRRLLAAFLASAPHVFGWDRNFDELALLQRETHLHDSVASEQEVSSGDSAAMEPKEPKKMLAGLREVFKDDRSKYGTITAIMNGDQDWLGKLDREFKKELFGDNTWTEKLQNWTGALDLDSYNTTNARVARVLTAGLDQKNKKTMEEAKTGNFSNPFAQMFSDFKKGYTGGLKQAQEASKRFFRDAVMQQAVERAEPLPSRDMQLQPGQPLFPPMGQPPFPGQPMQPWEQMQPQAWQQSMPPPAWQQQMQMPPWQPQMPPQPWQQPMPPQAWQQQMPPPVWQQSAPLQMPWQSVPPQARQWPMQQPPPWQQPMQQPMQWQQQMQAQQSQFAQPMLPMQWQQQQQPVPQQQLPQQGQQQQAQPPQMPQQQQQQQPQWQQPQIQQEQQPQQMRTQLLETPDPAQPVQQTSKQLQQPQQALPEQEQQLQQMPTQP